MNVWKVLNTDRTPCHGGTGVWPEPGQWLEVEGDLVPCSHGIHLCRRQDVIRWLGPTIWEAEYDGEPLVHDESKIVVSRARLVRRLYTWNDRSARLYAADCAERVLPIYEREHPSDARPRTAIQVARRYAVGEATDAELAAAWSAAWDTTREASGGVGKAASWAAAKAIAESVAGAAAWSAAWEAAKAAAWYAGAWDAADEGAKARAWATEFAWQTERLWTYLYPEEPE